MAGCCHVCVVNSSTTNQGQTVNTIKAKIKTLTTCDCGQSFFNDGIEVGQEYVVNPQAIIIDQLFCGRCNKVLKEQTRWILVKTVDEPDSEAGFTPVDHLDLDDDKLPKNQTLHGEWWKFSFSLELKSQEARDSAEATFMAGAMQPISLVKEYLQSGIRPHTAESLAQGKVLSDKLKQWDDEMLKFSMKMASGVEGGIPDIIKTVLDALESKGLKVEAVGGGNMPPEIIEKLKGMAKEKKKRGGMESTDQGDAFSM